jgi:phytoene synthase
MQFRNVLHKGEHGPRASAPAAQNGDVRQRLWVEADRTVCRDIARREARNFYWGFVALPRPQRTAIYALYAFARQVDDAVDKATSSEGGGCDQAQALIAALLEQRNRIAACYESLPVDPVMAVLADTVRLYDIPRQELEDLVTGVETDMTVTSYSSWASLRTYCHRVAGTVGMMCTRIFGFDDPGALSQADDLGIALQVTNILRDVREDFELGRVYLPREDLDRFDLKPEDLAASTLDRRWNELVEFEAARARELFESGLQVADHIPRRASACVMTMAGIYRRILDEVAADPGLPLRQRARLRKRTKLRVLVKSWLTAG